MKNKYITNSNTKGEFHGYQELYLVNGDLSFRGNFKNGRLIGYSERHAYKQTRYYIK